MPFDICSIDSTLQSYSHTYDAQIAEGTTKSKLVKNIISVCSNCLSDPGPTREAASFCLSSLLTRPDMAASILENFMIWSCDILEDWIKKGENVSLELSSQSFRVVGVLLCLSQIFKKGHRTNLLPHAALALGPCLQLANQANQTLTRKLTTKLFQRIGMTFLPPVVPKWRYQRGSRSLLSNLQSSGVSTIAPTNTATPSHVVGAEEEDEDEDIVVPADVEDIVGNLLTALRDKDTVVSSEEYFLLDSMDDSCTYFIIVGTMVSCEGYWKSMHEATKEVCE